MTGDGDDVQIHMWGKGTHLAGERMMVAMIDQNLAAVLRWIWQAEVAMADEGIGPRDAVLPDDMLRLAAVLLGVPRHEQWNQGVITDEEHAADGECDAGYHHSSGATRRSVPAHSAGNDPGGYKPYDPIL